MKRFTALGVAIVMMFCSVVTAFAAEQNVAQPGSPDFISLSQYIQQTEIDDVFKVVVAVEPPYIEVQQGGAVYVSVALDPSTSMTRMDIWDTHGQYNGTGTPAWITRYQALELAVSSLIHQLSLSGNPDVFINVRGHTRNPVTASDPNLQGFESIYKTGTLDIKDKFTYSDATWFMKNWYAGPVWGSSGDNNVGQALERVHNDIKQSFLLGGITEKDSRYILVMGDGADTNGDKVGSSQYNYNTQRIALACKAPLDPSYTSGNATATNQIAGLPQATFGGLGAKIWSVSVGSDINRNSDWQSDFFQTNYSNLWNFSGNPLTPFSPTLKLGNFNSLTKSEYWLIADSIDLPETAFPTAAVGGGTWVDYIDYAKTAIGGSFITGSADPNDDNVHYYHCLTTDGDPPAANLGSSTPSYTGLNNTYSGGSTANWQSNTDQLLDVFANFGQAAVEAAGGGADIKVGFTLNNNPFEGHTFTLYKYPGETEMIIPYTNDPDEEAQMKVSYKDNKISWEQKKMNGGYRYQVTFYVKYDGPGTDGKYFELIKNAYIEYENSKGDIVIKQFPSAYLNPTSQKEASNTVHLNSPEEGGVLNQPSTIASIAPGPIAGSGGLMLSEGILKTHYSSNKRIKTNKEKALIYQRTTSGKYKAVAAAKVEQAFTVVSVEGDFYKVIFKKKGAEKASTGYIKKADVLEIATAGQQTEENKVFLPSEMPQ